MADLLNSLSSINISTNGGFGQLTSVFTRGTESNHTKFILDGVIQKVLNLKRGITYRFDVSDNTSISMPMRNLLAIIATVSVGVWAYFGVLERITMLETKSVLLEKDMDQNVQRLEVEVESNSEFRIKWPRGEMGSLPADSEQFMLIEDLYGSVEKIENNLEQNMTNKVNIEFLQKQVEKMLEDIEKLKDANREIVYQNGN